MRAERHFYLHVTSIEHTGIRAALNSAGEKKDFERARPRLFSQLRLEDARSQEIMRKCREIFLSALLAMDFSFLEKEIG
jgi:hypothetical protein